MSRYDSRAGDPASYRDSRSDYGRGFESSVSREHPVAVAAAADLDGLTPFEKNLYVESTSVAAMTEAGVEEYRMKREITPPNDTDLDKLWSEEKLLFYVIIPHPQTPTL